MAEGGERKKISRRTTTTMVIIIMVYSCASAWKKKKKLYAVPQTVRGQGSAAHTCGVVKDGHTAVFAVARIPICRTDGRRERFPCPSSASLINRVTYAIYIVSNAPCRTLLRETDPRPPTPHATHTHPPRVCRYLHVNQSAADRDFSNIICNLYTV